MLEPDELFYVDLSTPTNATISDHRATIITNDDLKRPGIGSMGDRASATSPTR